MTHPNLAKWAKALEELASDLDQRALEFASMEPPARQAANEGTGAAHHAVLGRIKGKRYAYSHAAQLVRGAIRQALSEIKAEAYYDAPNPPEAGEGSAQSQPCTDAQEHSHDAPGVVDVLREFVRRVDAVRNAKGSLNAIFEAHGQLVALGADARRVLDARE